MKKDLRNIGTDLLDATAPPKLSATCPECGHTKRPGRAIVSREFEVMDIAGYSIDGGTFYIDKRLPEKMKGIPVDLFLEIHEVVEKALEDKLGFGYDHAHEIATAAEQTAVEISGYSFADYSYEMDYWVRKLINTANKADTPDDIEVPENIKGR